MPTTQLKPHALPGRRYGSFAGKEESLHGPHTPGKITQLAAHAALPMGRYGSFAGKTESAATGGGDVSTFMRRRIRRWRNAKYRYRRGPN